MFVHVWQSFQSRISNYLQIIVTRIGWRENFSRLGEADESARAVALLCSKQEVLQHMTLFSSREQNFLRLPSASSCVIFFHLYNVIVRPRTQWYRLHHPPTDFATRSLRYSEVFETFMISFSCFPMCLRLGTD